MGRPQKSRLQRFHKKARHRSLGWQPVIVLLVTMLLGVLTRMKVIGRENLPDGPFILAPNHPSVADPLFVAVVLHRKASFMGKSELFHSRWGKWFSRVGGFPVERGSWDTEAFQTAEEVLQKGRVMIMFPEGGITGHPLDDDGNEMPMRLGKAGVGYLAEKTQLPVVPCWLEGSRKLYKPWTWPKVRVVFGEPIVFDNGDTGKEQSLADAAVIRDAIIDLRNQVN